MGKIERRCWEDLSLDGGYKIDLQDIVWQGSAYGSG
jgi:hypothetical protein